MNIYSSDNSTYRQVTAYIQQNQITNNCNLLYKDGNLNAIVRIFTQNLFYPLYGNPVEMRVQNDDGECLTKSHNQEQ